MSANKFKCGTCNKVLASKKNLRAHANLHAKIYQCIFCEKSFYTIKILFDHYRVHNKEKPRFCMLCDKTFTRQYSLRSHIMYHTHTRISATFVESHSRKKAISRPIN